MSKLIAQATAAKKAAGALAHLATGIKDEALEAMAVALEEKEDDIINANAEDLKAGREKGLSTALLDRLALDSQRVAAMAEGLRTLQSLTDPIGEIISMWRRPNGMQVGQMRVPLGVIGIIYEARPNVTVDAAGLCLKAGNAVILRGGSEAINSNKAIVEVISRAATLAGIPAGAIQLITTTDRAAAVEMMRLNDYIDVLIPRGGSRLIETVIENATVPIIQTGIGNCHVYVDGEADLKMAEQIAYNAKTHRPGVCNAAESLLVDQLLATQFLPSTIKALEEGGVEVRGCPETKKICPGVKAASEEDWGTEYLDYIISVKVVNGLDDAIRHINKYGTGHSEAIVTESYHKARRFLEEIDAAAVYVNVSTRFTDGFEFGFGAEIGISTQKLHTRGPMGLKELTTIKYIVLGSGQIRR